MDPLPSPPPPSATTSTTDHAPQPSPYVEHESPTQRALWDELDIGDAMVHDFKCQVWCALLKHVNPQPGEEPCFLTVVASHCLLELDEILVGVLLGDQYTLQRSFETSSVNHLSAINPTPLPSSPWLHRWMPSSSCKQRIAPWLLPLLRSKKLPPPWILVTASSTKTLFCGRSSTPQTSLGWISR